MLLKLKILSSDKRLFSEISAQRYAKAANFLLFNYIGHSYTDNNERVYYHVLCTEQ